MSEDPRQNNGLIGFAGTDISYAAFVLRLMARESWAFANSDLPSMRRNSISRAF